MLRHVSAPTSQIPPLVPLARCGKPDLGIFCRMVFSTDTYHHHGPSTLFGRQSITYRLQVSAGVSLSIHIKGFYVNIERVKGRADWALLLGYNTFKSDAGAILIIAEAMIYESTAVRTLQLLVYMAAVYEARQNRVSRTIIWMVSDSKESHLSFPKEKTKLLRHSFSFGYRAVKYFSPISR